MKIIRLIRTASVTANIIVAVSLALLLIKIFILNRYEMGFFGAHELSSAFDDILISIIASYLFYLFVVHLKELNDKETVKPFLHKHAKFIVHDAQQQLSDLSKASSIEINLENISSDLIEQVLKNIQRNSSAPLIIGEDSNGFVYADWHQYLVYHVNRVESETNKLFKHIVYLDPPLIKLLTTIEDSTFLNALPWLLTQNFRDVSLFPFRGALERYFYDCKSLKDYFYEVGDTY